MPTILVALGNADINFMTCEVLRAYLNCKTIDAESGDECLRAAEENEVDVVVLCTRLFARDGLEVYKALKKGEKTASIPVILVASNVNEIRNGMLGLETGADDYLVQPVDNLDLVARVRLMVRLKRLMDLTAGSAEPVSRLTPREAHRLRSPLNSIIGMAELLQKPFYGELSERQREFAQIIANSGRQLLGYINELVEH